MTLHHDASKMTAFVLFVLCAFFENKDTCVVASEIKKYGLYAFWYKLSIKSTVNVSYFCQKVRNHHPLRPGNNGKTKNFKKQSKRNLFYSLSLEKIDEKYKLDIL